MEKILPICKVLDVSPEWLLSDIDPAEGRDKNHEYYVVAKDTDTGILVSDFNIIETNDNVPQNLTGH